MKIFALLYYAFKLFEPEIFCILYSIVDFCSIVAVLIYAIFCVNYLSGILGSHPEIKGGPNAA